MMTIWCWIYTKSHEKKTKKKKIKKSNKKTTLIFSFSALIKKVSLYIHKWSYGLRFLCLTNDKLA